MHLKRLIPSKPLFMFLLVLYAILLGNCSSEPKYAGYLFTYFTGNGPGEESIHFAVSEDGFTYRALNNNEPVIDSREISSTGGVRDPHILRTADGHGFYMVATDLYVPEMGWKNYALILMKSDDLIHWQSTVVNIPQSFPDEFGDVYRVWAPQTFYDPETGKYMVYFSMKQGDDPDKIYYAWANEDFTGLETVPRQLYYPPEESNNRACIDGDIIYKDRTYYLFHKAEDGKPGIKLAVSDSLTKGYKLTSNERVDCETVPVEGSGIFKLNNSDTYILLYDMYTSGKYQFAQSTDLKNFKVIDEKISMNFKPRHGTIMPITREEMDRLIEHWGSLADLAPFFTRNPSVKQKNMVYDEAGKSLFIPVVQGTDLHAFDPGFITLPGTEITPPGPQDFTSETVDYTFRLKDKGSITYTVTAAVNNNPVLPGYYADPEIIYSEKTGKFHLYPTSDGFRGWSGTYFESFSSDDLVTWHNDGKILDLNTDVSWANRNAWAPCIMEKKMGDDYQYYFYFTAAQKIGVAVADDPAGPFKDSGKPLIAFKPDGVRGGQEIDPDVFHDPVSGKDLLYWGNGYMALAALNDDGVGIDPTTLRVITPDETFREGTEVFYREGKYYFLWSEDDTRSPNYRVRYGTSSSPYEIQDIPRDNIVIEKDTTAMIYGTGHNSVIRIPGTDDWYIVYHRFTLPEGISMGRAAGFHREVCIDKLMFDKEGAIIKTIPTKEGIRPVGLASAEDL